MKTFVLGAIAGVIGGYWLSVALQPQHENLISVEDVEAAPAPVMSVSPSTSVDSVVEHNLAKTLSSSSVSSIVSADDAPQLHNEHKEITTAQNIIKDQSNLRSEQLPSSEGNTLPPEEREELESYYEARKQADEYSDFVQKNVSPEGFGHEKILDTRFQTDPVDSEWSLQATEKLQQIIQQQDAWKPYSIQQVQCKTRGCRIEIIAQNRADANEYANVLGQTLGDWGVPGAYVHGFDASRNLVYLYLPRSKEQRWF
jgi:hypothetical protein